MVDYGKSAFNCNYFFPKLIFTKYVMQYHRRNVIASVIVTKYLTGERSLPLLLNKVPRLLEDISLVIPWGIDNVRLA